LTPFTPVFESTIRGWRIDRDIHAPTWDSAVGAFGSGGRWNPRGVSAVYAALDAATAIVEVAVHKGFYVLDTVPHVITAFEIDDPAMIHVVKPSAVPNPNWLVPSIPTPGQQRFGADLLAKHLFVAIPSAVSQHSWNLLFDPSRAAGHYKMVLQEPVAIDPRLNTATSAGAPPRPAIP
jgi:RES domain-containing protein